MCVVRGRGFYDSLSGIIIDKATLTWRKKKSGVKGLRCGRLITADWLCSSRGEIAAQRLPDNLRDADAGDTSRTKADNRLMPPVLIALVLGALSQSGRWVVQSVVSLAVARERAELIERACDVVALVAICFMFCC